MARRWFENNPGMPATMVIDSTRQPVAPKDTQLNTGYATSDLIPGEAAGWIEVRTRNVWWLVRVGWGVLGVGSISYYADRAIDTLLFISIAGGLGFLIYIPGWLYHEYVTDKVYALFKERYQGVTQKITEPPPAAPTGRGVRVEGDAGVNTLRRLEAELKYALIRAVHTPASPRDNDNEVIPGVNVRMDKDLYRFLMYVLRELELVTGGKDPHTGKRSKWQCNYKSEPLALSAYERRKGRLRMIDLDAIASLADVEDWNE